MPRGLIVMTSVQKYPTANKATGTWLAEVTHLIDELTPQGWVFDYVSPRGGYAPIDPVSLQFAPDEIDWRWYSEPQFRILIGSTLTPEAVNAADYQFVYYAGGHGVVWDFIDNPKLQEITRTVYENGGFVGGVCHGTVGLLNVRLTNGEYLIKGKNVTGFSNDEEADVKAVDLVPYLLEDQIKKRGAHYSRLGLWEAHVASDQRVITGQNPASTHGIALALLKQTAK